MNHSEKPRDAAKKARLLLLGLELYNIGQKLRTCPPSERDGLEQRFLEGERRYDKLLKEIRNRRQPL